jgi:molecular chaperone IbpA
MTNKNFPFLWTVTSESAHDYPRYNIVKTEEGTVIEVAVPGRGHDSVEVFMEDGHLVISGAKLPTTETDQVLHKGISGKAFKKYFTIAKGAEVADATLKDGLLSILVVETKNSPLRIEVK